ncbi:MAG: glycosyltransferase family 4 protein [Thermodesulfobacteriota bacterium]
MIYTVLPVGSFHGWGVCGKYIIRELSKKETVLLVNGELSADAFENVLDYRFFTSLSVGEKEKEDLLAPDNGPLPGPVLQAMTNHDYRPLLPQVKGKTNFGYTFFEDNVIPRSNIENAENSFDLIIAGSSWCEEMLRFHGLKRVKTIIQGIDPMIFNPHQKEKEYFRDRFVIFSGGKFELRKGQDIVIKAFKALQDRYDDVLLVTGWFNQWPQSIHTMSGSPYLKFQMASNDFFETITQVLVDNGIDLKKVINLPLYPNVNMPAIYKNTDLGFFPNRCEGGTNLVMMEYMACGKPVLGSFSSGQKDVLSDQNALIIRKMGTLDVSVNGTRTAVWDEPHLDETIEKLDWAYHHRKEIQTVGQQAGKDLAELTWGRTGNQFYNVITGD